MNMEWQNETWLTHNFLNTNVSHNSTNHTSIDNFALTVGWVYIFTGIIFIFLQLVCAYLMQTDKDMQNPTYKLMVNLSINDAVELVPLALYAGISILLDYEDPIVARVASFLCLSPWYTNCILFVYMSFSRWIAITKPQLSHIFTKTVMRCLHISAWVPVGVVMFYANIFPDPPQFPYYRKIFAWGFNLDTGMGVIRHWINFCTDTLASILEMTFNVLAMIYVHQTRNHVRSFTSTLNRRRETKLLIQCFIVGCVFMVADITFTLSFGLGWKSRVAFFCTQFTWTFNHCVNPLVYFSVNTRLRKRFWGFITFGKFGKGKIGSTS